MLLGVADICQDLDVVHMVTDCSMRFSLAALP